MPDSRRRAADAYGRLLHDVYAYPAAAAEEEAEPPHITEMELQALWAAGMLGQGGQTRGHAAVLAFGLMIVMMLIHGMTAVRWRREEEEKKWRYNWW